MITVNVASAAILKLVHNLYYLAQQQTPLLSLIVINKIKTIKDKWFIFGFNERIYIDIYKICILSLYMVNIVYNHINIHLLKYEKRVLK